MLIGVVLVSLRWIYLAQGVTLSVLLIALIMNINARLRHAGWCYNTSVKNNELNYKFSEFIKKS